MSSLPPSLPETPHVDHTTSPMVKILSEAENWHIISQKLSKTPNNSENSGIFIHYIFLKLFLGTVFSAVKMFWGGAEMEASFIQCACREYRSKCSCSPVQLQMSALWQRSLELEHTAEIRKSSPGRRSCKAAKTLTHIFTCGGRSMNWQFMLLLFTSPFSQGHEIELPNVTGLTRCEQVWPDVTGVTRCDRCDQVWPVGAKCDQMWLDVTRYDHVHVWKQAHAGHLENFPLVFWLIESSHFQVIWS